MAVTFHFIVGAFHPNATDQEVLAQARIDVGNVFAANTVCDWENVRYGRDSSGNACAFVPVIEEGASTANADAWRTAYGQYQWM